ncbi:hypothetical protein PX699_00210 [Sphingobium sp. H39-3-25]|uniref:hypothetical protein n=1 Tax=Sphingobium arseniciresistens TaxID=3030834 RepID=UPI0023B97DFF|nr:hypothetical protein [Sphingobium arseniciresistens]
MRKWVAGLTGATALIGFAIWGLDKLGIINRYAFEWGDFATLATGALAVAGAIYVGHRQIAIITEQTAISKKQAAISERQVQLQQANMLADLFDRRMDAYNSVIDLLRRFDDPTTIESKRTWMDDFNTAANKCRFLFRKDVHNEVHKIFTKWNSFQQHKEQNKLKIDEKFIDTEIQKKEMEFIVWQMGMISSMYKVFYPEMNLSGQFFSPPFDNTASPSPH